MLKAEPTDSALYALLPIQFANEDRIEFNGAGVIFYGEGLKVPRFGGETKSTGGTSNPA